MDATHIRLAATLNDALAGKPIFLTSTGGAGTHSLVIRPTAVQAGALSVPLPKPMSTQLVSVTAAGAGGSKTSGAGAIGPNQLYQLSLDQLWRGSAGAARAGF